MDGYSFIVSFSNNNKYIFKIGVFDTYNVFDFYTKKESIPHTKRIEINVYYIYSIYFTFLYLTIFF